MNTYQDSGVSISDGDTFIDHIRASCESTYTANVYEGVGGFCSLFRSMWDPKQLIAASTDGVGSKAQLAYQLREYGCLSTIGLDLVGMVINDILTCGAIPMFMLDYYACPSIRGDDHFESSDQIIRGIATGCKWAKVALIGGETAEMPRLYESDQFDLAGFGVGMVDERLLLGKHRVKYNDTILGFKSSGPHANGFSLINSIVDDLDWNEHEYIRYDLMMPTQIYSTEARILRNEFSGHLHAMAHITGGGLEANTNRVIPDGWCCSIDWNSWVLPNIFSYIQNCGKIDIEEMHKVFNCGIGYTVIVDPSIANRIISRFQGIGIDCIPIGRVTE